MVFVFSSALASLHPRGALRVVVEMVQTFSVMVLSQTLTRVATGMLGASPSMHWSLASTHLAAGVSLLLLLSALPTALAERAFTQRFVGIMLFMLTDASASILEAVDGAISALWWCVLSMALLKLGYAVLQRRTLRYVFQLLNMLVVNTAITSLTRQGNVDVQAATLLVAVFALDLLRTLDRVLDDARNYAVWKVSQQLFGVYSRMATDDVLLLYVSVSVVLVQTTLHLHHSTLTEIALLLAVNQILNSMRASMTVCGDSSQFTLLMLYIILIHTTQELTSQKVWRKQ